MNKPHLLVYLIVFLFIINDYYIHFYSFFIINDLFIVSITNKKVKIVYKNKTKKYLNNNE